MFYEIAIALVLLFIFLPVTAVNVSPISIDPTGALFSGESVHVSLNIEFSGTEKN
jgi:hypothetical protein